MTENEVKLTTGCCAVLNDTEGLQNKELKVDQKGMVNSIMDVEGVTYIQFMPMDRDDGKSFVIKSSRVTPVK